MTSLPFFGKALGAIACGPIAERWGRKKAVLVLAILSLMYVCPHNVENAPKTGMRRLTLCNKVVYY
jgi:MFS family permease